MKRCRLELGVCTECGRDDAFSLLHPVNLILLPPAVLVGVIIGIGVGVVPIRVKCRNCGHKGWIYGD